MENEKGIIATTGIRVDMLEKLRDHTAKIPQEKFDMETYRADIVGVESSFVSLENCGTIGCIIGHAPFIGGEFAPIKSDFRCFWYSNNKILDFYSYATRVLGPIPPSAWEYMFGCSWADVDNTVEGAVKRMDRVISDIKNATFNDELYSELSQERFKNKE